MRILEMAEDGSMLKLWISAGMDIHNDTLWHPKSLLKEVIENVGYPQPVALAGGHDVKLLADCMCRTWEAAAEWQAGAIKYLIKAHDLDVVFSHFHSVDLQGHMLVQYLKKGSKLPAATIQELYTEVMVQADRYIGQFLSLIDEGWTIMVVADHGQACPHVEASPLMMTPYMDGVSMVKMGYTVLKKDENGNDLPEIDWTKTKAIIWRMGEVWLNIKGRDKHIVDGVEIDGIVDPEDQYELEEQIMTDLYSWRNAETGHREVYIAVRNKDAIAFGMGGPNAADILFYTAEGYISDHGDSLSTVDGACGTSVRSIFLAAGGGIKKDYLTTRKIHHIDIVPTMATLLGTRMPNECEGAPIYQILE